MTLVKLGYVAMSVNLTNASPSKTMTYTQFPKIKDREAAIDKLERISNENLANCLRLLKHNVAHDISFFRFSSKLIPLANHEELKDWKFMRPIKDILHEIGDYLEKHPMRIDFHPDHFVLLNSKKKEILNTALKTLSMHHALLKGMRVPTEHRCVLHIGGGYDDRELALEQFIHNFALVPQALQEMLILENDDTTFHLRDTLYICEKLNIPLVFDYHHHLAHYEKETKGWEEHWGGILKTWENSSLPIKMHISSPRDDKNFRAHAEYVDPKMFMDFLHGIRGSTEEIHCMIEAKKKDEALFQLMQDMQRFKEVEIIDGASFWFK
ncbi:UV DNA damage repair endonuclease UvsE [Sutcliffiella rhizosphaerae]|uniref:UV DNA damage endonuclease n=1 Tax=Sutcliffiella rhizosphaerae TaxID=2880967 RepID=A0ABN8AI10_9BACI|nr:UV DNA damage repair endonuclease UvsE [Sutcliffiella rhizosphaerae]CAG9623367.1 UV DNA damage endonuclease [Sutcliffiella rhizosphaerae]